MSYKVIQWATGGVGQAAIAGILDHPELRLAGCWVHSEAKCGQDAGVLAGREPVGVLATNDVEEILAIEADCVLYSPLLPNEDEVVRLLESGKSVVTPVGWVYPFKTMNIGRLEAACFRGKTVLHGTGIHPGGMTERFPLVLSSLSRAITRVRSEEFSDIRTYDAPEVVSDLMLFGKSPEEALASPMVQFLSGGFSQSIHMVADALDVCIDSEIRTTHQVAVATQNIDTPIGVIEPGKVAAQRFCWQGMLGDHVVVEAIVNWFMGEEHFDQDWSFGSEGPRFEVEVVGDPPLKCVYHGLHPATVQAGLIRNEGIVATAMHCVNAVPYVCDAAPGIRSYVDLPLIAGRAAPHLVKWGGSR